MWSHLNLLIRNRDKDGKDLDMIFAIGPGYGVPATLAALWLDGSLQKLLPEMAYGPEGFSNLTTKFSVPTGLRYVSYVSPRRAALFTSLFMVSLLSNTH